MQKPIRSVGIISKDLTKGVHKTLTMLLDFLFEQNIAVVVEENTAAGLEAFTLTTHTRETLGGACELIIVVGGDGSLINAAHTAIQHNTPVLGINRGNLGFLTDIRPQDMHEKLLAILQGHYHEEPRFFLNADILIDNVIQSSHTALNEITLLPGPIPHIIEFEIYIDTVFMCSQRSDGLIVASPTGSTAYALSGGGPILHPELNAIVIVPMFPHSLNVRPIVIDANHTIDVVITKNNDTLPRISCDSRGYTNIYPGNILKIKKRKEALRLLHPLDYDYYGALRSKLHWGKKIFEERDDESC